MFQGTSRRAVRLGAILLSCSALAAVPSAAQTPGAASSATAPKDVRFGTWGVDLSTRDTAVKPGDDFQRYASGKWLDANPIPADKSQNGIGSEVNDRNQERLQSIVMGAPKDSQLGAFYASYMDEARLEQLDMAPLKPELDKVAAINDKAAFTKFMADSHADFGSTLFGSGVLPDFNNPTVNTAFVGTSGMGLPDRDYYLLDKYKPQRDAYRAYIERVLTLTGTPNAAAAADSVLAFETEIAKLSWSQTDQRDIDKLNNPMTLAELAAYAPGIDWAAYLKEVKVDRVPKLIVGDNTAVKAMAVLYAKTPLDTLKTWQRFKVTDQASNYLSKRFVDSKFAFTKTLSGAKELRPRWRRGIGEVDGRLGELLGKTYIDRYFSPQSKAMMEQLVANLKLAAADRITSNSWMTNATKKAALTKLDKMQVMVG